jgi:hypothetical protein
MKKTTKTKTTKTKKTTRTILYCVPKDGREKLTNTLTDAYWATSKKEAIKDMQKHGGFTPKLVIRAIFTTFDV